VWAPIRANGSSFALPVMAWQLRENDRPGPLLYWGAKAPASLRFYSRGAAVPTPDLPAHLRQMDAGSRVYVAIDSEQLPALRQLTYMQPEATELQVVHQVKHGLIAEVSRR
jgi:hypothetical protein